MCFAISGDVDGSLEAILSVLDTYRSPQCQLNLLSYGVGNITEYDIEMAAAFDGTTPYKVLFHLLFLTVTVFSVT